MTREEMLRIRRQVARKLVSAVALLLVSSIMLGMSTYAWRVMSTAPEVKEIKTTAGSNGSLEIALQSAASEGAMSRAEITHGAGDSLLPPTLRNNTWGNIIELDAEDYGIDAVTLYPSHLNLLTGEGAVPTVNTANYLSIPEFGADGRISQMNDAAFLQYSSWGNTFTESRTYGVNILGTTDAEISAKESVTYYYRRSAIRDEAAGYLEQYRTSLRDDLVNLLEENNAGILNLLYGAWKALKSTEGSGYGDEPWDEDDLKTARAIISGMISITREAEVSLKWALLARAVADDTNYPKDNKTAEAALGELYRIFLTYPLKSEGEGNSIFSIAQKNGYTELTGAISSLVYAEGQLAQALDGTASTDTLTNAIIKILDPTQTFMMGGTQNMYDNNGEQINASEGDPASGTPGYIYDEGHNIYYLATHGIETDYLYFVCPASGQNAGLFSIMAGLLGDYEASESAYFNARQQEFVNEKTNSGPWTIIVRATGRSGDSAAGDKYAVAKSAIAKYSPENNRGVLGDVYDSIKRYNPKNAMISFTVEKREGSAYGYSVDLAFQSSESCELLLRQEAADRVFGLNEQYGEANASLLGAGSNLDVTLSGDYLTGTQSDAAKELIESLFIVLTDTDTGQILGLVCADEPEIVLEQGTAVLSLYDPVVSEDGVLSRGEKRENNVITTMTADKPVYITAIVYLNGDVLSSGALGATQRPSLYGEVNLQFISSATLTPMDYRGYQE